MQQIWYDIYDGNKKKDETLDKTEAIAKVTTENARTRTSKWSWRMRREKLNPATQLAAPFSY
jgi:hypothetical protein